MTKQKRKNNRIERIEQLIKAGRYDEAENLLKNTIHPDTPKLLKQINALKPAPIDIVGMRI